MRATCTRLGNLGRMANSMFQIAAVYGYSKKQSLPFNWYIPKWKYSHAFEGPFNEKDDLGQRWTEYQEPYFQYKEIPPIMDVDLVGYFQSKKYWEHCEQDIKNMFTFKPEIISDVRGWIDNKREGKIPVSVQVRLTDYITMAHYYPNLSWEWYEEAMNKFDDTHHFFVTSDDIALCNIRMNNRKNITFSHFDEVKDLCLGSLCTHNIIANSSYGFWQQELNNNPNKRVIVPTTWFHPIANHNTSDLYLNTWELLKNK